MSPVGNESHSQHDSSPKDGDCGEENTRSDLANEQVGRQFEDDLFEEGERTRVSFRFLQ